MDSKVKLTKKYFQEQIEQIKFVCSSLENEQKHLTADMHTQLDSTQTVLEQIETLKVNDDANRMTELLESVGALHAKEDNIIGGISGFYQKDFPIDVRFEREYYKDFPLCVSSDAPNFKSDFLKLISGLDVQSVETVILSLQRLKLIRNSDGIIMALYSETEKQATRDLNEHFFSNIYQLSDDCFFYRGMMLPINQFEPCVFVDELMLPELAHVERFADKDIIDAGAFIGDSALVLSKYTTGNIYAFEPTPGNYDNLKKTIQLNNLTNVEPLPFALGAESGKTVISVSGSASTQFEKNGITYTDKVEVPIVKIDDFVKEHNVKVGLIKSDIEGAETQMLHGAIETIKTQRPALLISIYHNANDYFGIKPWLESLDLGYKFKIRHSVGGTVMTETTLIAEVD